MNDSLHNAKNIIKITNIEYQYKYEKENHATKLKQQQKDAIRTEKDKQRKTVRNFLIAGFILMLLIVLVVLGGFLQKRKDNNKLIKHNAKIEEQKSIIEHKNINITDSINYAQHIQESVFLSDNSIKKYFENSFLINQPKDVVSGDFFWCTEHNNKKIFAVVDCTGHGVPGAFLSLIGNSLLNEIIKEKGIYEPSEILNNMHLGVIEALKQGTANDGMDMVICVYDTKSRELQFSGATNFIYLHNGNELKMIEGDPFSIGETPYSKNIIVKFNTQTMKIEFGTKLYLMTDGYMDQFGGPKNKKFNQIPFEKMLTKIYNMPMNEQKEKLLQTFAAWKGLNKQIDDVMVMGVSL